jgi:hypothetical protein
MKDVLARYRQALLVYSVYCRAHDRAAELTRVPLYVRPAAECLSQPWAFGHEHCQRYCRGGRS